MKYSEKTRRALKAYTTLQRASESALQWSAESFRRHNLSASQFGVLEALYHLGSLNQKDLGQKILKSSGNMTLVIDNLEKRELVKRKRCENDRRILYVDLTSAGRRLIEKILPEHVADLEQKLSILTAEEQEQLQRLCKKVGLQR